MSDINPLKFFKCLSDETRLKTLLLICEMQELCVCDVVEALQLDQPKISRHLAELRKCGILVDERRGKWVYYQLHPQLPVWAVDIIKSTAKHNTDYINEPLHKLRSSSQTCC